MIKPDSLIVLNTQMVQNKFSFFIFLRLLTCKLIFPAQLGVAQLAKNIANFMQSSEEHSFLDRPKGYINTLK